MTPSTRAYGFDSLRLLREDLERVVDLLRSTKPESVVVLSDAARTYSSFDEMRRLNGNEVSYLVLNNEEVGIKLEIQKAANSRVISTVKQTDDAELTFYRVRDFLLPKLNAIPRYWMQVVGMLCMATLLAST